MYNYNILMKTVTHICYAASSQTAAYRLHRSLIHIGCESSIITGAKSIIDKDLIQPCTLSEKMSAVTGVLRERLYKRLFYEKNTTYFSLNIGPRLLQNSWLKKIYETKTDLIHLHWIGNGFIPLRDLIKLKKPIVWTMHDFWPITGGCHVIGECCRFKEHCGFCPQIGSNKKRDLSNKIFKIKEIIYNKLDLTIIAPSKWVESEAKKSPLLNHIKIVRIPNAIDTTVFKPINKKFAREILNLDSEKQIIAFGAISGTSDPNKGFNLLIEAIKIVSDQNKNLLLLIFGASVPKNVYDFGCETKYIGKLSDDITLSLVYAAADIVVVPSKQESFSQVSSESIACGTPVVAFDSTGPKDIIDHKKNGYLARSYDSNDLANGILWILEDKERWNLLSVNARDKAVTYFSYDVVGTRHKELYDEILEMYGTKL